MPIGRTRSATLVAALVALAVGSCFVDLGECVSQGVAINPCVNHMQLGQTTILEAHVDGAPGADITWVLPAVLQTGFQIEVGSNTLQLIGSSNLAGTYRVRAQSTSDSAMFGEAFLTVAAQNFGYPPPPIQINGADFPNDYQAAVASGGGYFYMAYADLPNPLPPGSPAAATGTVDPSNYFVRQFLQSTNTETSIATGQFLSYQQGLPTEPNITADCHGNGYWVDWIDFDSPVLRRMDIQGVVSADQPMGQLYSVGPLAVACDGSIYFLGEGYQVQGLYRIGAFGELAQLLDVDDLPSLYNQYQSLAVDPQSRVLLGARAFAFPAAPSEIVRLVVDGASASVDPTFAFSRRAVPAFFNSVDHIAVDGAGAIYAAVTYIEGVPPLLKGPGPPVIVGINGAGLALFTIDSYVYNCPAGCTLDCGASLGFQSIQSLSAGPSGGLFVLDDVTMGSEDVPAECQVTVRLILLHPN